ncbi:hypothetical protein PG994_000265 [Apiospora phragmitis]|uniref:Uncharacterized protein n=1 Tax=Apiospora phragmitis TaxID=2905665 RepID=A0ABR1X5T2_9PEZI
MPSEKGQGMAPPKTERRSCMGVVMHPFYFPPNSLGSFAKCVSSVLSDKASLQNARANLEDYKSVFAALRSGSDGEAAEILARLRMGMDLRFFGNLPFSSGFKANHYPAKVQDVQVSNICNDLWAAVPANCRPGGCSLGILDIAHQLIAAGTPARVINGERHNVLAVASPAEFARSSLLSQWAARFIFSITGTTRSLTSITAAWRVWVLMRWRIDPSPETYAAMPEWMRPTIKQLLYPHVEIVDLVAYPKLRDAVISRPSAQAHPDLVWLMDAYRGCRCSFAMEFPEIVCYNKTTGQPDFTDHAKACVADLDNWTIGPVFRRYLPNMDQLVDIGLDDDFPEPRTPLG